MWPQFSTIEKKIQDKIKGSDTKELSKKACWIRVISGANTGLVMYSNTDSSVFTAIGEASIYGDITKSGTVGVTLSGTPITAENDYNVYKPSPIITALTVKEGKDQISRQAELTFKVFTLGQLEIIQEYFMEPGFSLLIEYGWNSASAYKRLINYKSSKFTSLVAEYNLNQDLLHERRVGSNGEYDSFFGFIVGGDVSTGDDETFNVKIKLRGAPGLPTYLQGHNNIKKQDENGKIANDLSYAPYAVADLDDAEQNIGVRRLKYLFNSLPKTRQTKDVVDNVISKPLYSYVDFINFDKVQENLITNGADEDGTKHKGVSIPKEKLYSSQKYIRFKLAIDILNANTSLNSIVVGNKKVQIIIDIDDCIIGGFPQIFSTKKDKLIIPGKIPDFSTFFLNESGEIDLSKYGPIDNSIVYQRKTDDSGNVTNSENEVIKFLGDKPLDVVSAKDKNGGDKVNGATKEVIKRGYKEKAEYYGYLKNLYINFDLFYKEMDSRNKTSRQVLETLLNEMSSAVNSFWKFQVIESTHDEYKDGKLVDSYLRYKIIDENWVGANTSEPALFYHNGEQSRFTQANLTMNIPGQMTSQIVLKRLNLTSNPDAPEVKLGGLFSKSKDMFMKGIIDRGNNVNAETGKKEETDEEYQARLKENERLNGVRYITTADGETRKIEVEIERPGMRNYSRYTATQEWASESIKKEAKGIEDREQAQIDQQALLYKDKLDRDALAKKVNDARGDELKKLDKELKALDKKIKDQKKSIEDVGKKLAEDSAALEKKNEEQKQSNITTNLDKIDIVLNPEYLGNNEDEINNFRDKKNFRNTFRIYCCDDTDLFDTLRKNAFNGEGDGESGRYSHPLPIKYQFTVKGISGIRRGDTFNIIGIPAKYREHGLFQITEVDHQITNAMWETEVMGEYRQLQ